MEGGREEMRKEDREGWKKDRVLDGRGRGQGIQAGECRWLLESGKGKAIFFFFPPKIFISTKSCSYPDLSLGKPFWTSDM